MWTHIIFKINNPIIEHDVLMQTKNKLMAFSGN